MIFGQIFVTSIGDAKVRDYAVISFVRRTNQGFLREFPALFYIGVGAGAGRHPQISRRGTRVASLGIVRVESRRLGVASGPSFSGDR